MATNTTNLSLIKPDLTDKIRIAQINQNMDIIDEKLGPVGSTSLQSQVTPLTTKTANYDKLIENGTDLNSLLTTGVYKSPATAAGVHTLLNCPVETPFVMVVRGEGEIDGCVQLLCGGVSIYTRRGTGSGFPAEWTVPTGGATPSGEYTIDDLYDAIDELLANAKDEIVAELVDDTAGEGDTGKVWSADKLATSFDEKANADGYYEDLTAGNAEQLISAVSVKDTALYTFRTAGGSADIGDREVDKLIGGTIAWNQNVKNGNFTSTNNWVTSGMSMSVSNEIATLTKQIKNPAYAGFNVAYNDHVYLGTAQLKGENAFIGFKTGNNATHGDSRGSATQSDNAFSDVYFMKKRTDSSATIFCVRDVQSEVDSVFYAKNVCLFDLTQMFGSTIADYIYGLETATPGAGVAWFKRYFPKDYYAYNAGELMSVNVASHDMVGFNAWDKSKAVTGQRFTTTGTGNVANIYTRSDYTRCIPGAVYYFKNVITTASSYSAVFWYDEQKNYITSNSIGDATHTSGNLSATAPQNAYYMGINMLTAEVDVCCVNLSWDGERNGEYEAYEKHSYPIGNVELRGIPKLDANNSLYYDGDEYTHDGTVTRKYGIVDLGTLNWAYFTSPNRFSVTFTDAKHGGLQVVPNATCPKYKVTSFANSITENTDKTVCFWGSSTSTVSGNLNVVDSAYSDAATFKTAMSGVYLVYELATPTTETADPYQDPQIVDDFGTEEYVDRGVATSARDVSIPVGHETYYQANLRAKLEMAPNSPADGDGDYIVRQSNGENTYVPLVIPTELPTAPTTDGTYILKVTVSSGTPTLTWAAQ